ncbi:trafficking kinesin-binding protein 1-like isoform X2 [Babylonia areolata]|uniref:trafficking kinesin-binding protein 1-like isoform X2 n=1 Tax=Babylonia areolata TaxID=304850 RepID=UPI003FCF55DE
MFSRKVDYVLCAERVTQMTKTYNDIEAVTRLLEEKERDLELAARIGQTLLTKNKELSCRGDTLDEQLTHANEKINQLRHDVAVKDELLKLYCEDLQDQSPGDGSPGVGTTNLSKINLDLLQKKVQILEEENLTLRFESAQLRSDTESYEEKEKKLVEDCLQQLGEVNQQVETFAEELRMKTEESSRQKEEMTSVLSQVADLHKRVRQLTIENMDLSEKLQASHESQRQLTKQLSGQQDKYDELFEMLEEAQDELRGHRNRNTPKARCHLYASAALQQGSGALDSLASELQNSMQQEDEEKRERRARSWKVFETARAARKAASKSSHDSSVRMSTSVSDSQTASMVNSDSESFYSDGYSADMDSICGSSTELGRPGIPGSNDLESALKRLAMRRANDMNEHDYMEAHRETRSEGMVSPARKLDTPDGMASPASCYSYLGHSSNSHGASSFKMSDKLQIVKPLEGSVTLRHWQRLAQPHLGGLFERREGVKVKGERRLDLEGEVYTLSDFEEDEDDVVECPSRRVADSSTIYTFTNSVVSHPGEQSQNPGESGNCLQPVGSSSPRPESKRASNTSSSYTMSLGLAAILQDRGMSSSTTGSVLRPIASCPVMPPPTTATLTASTTITPTTATVDTTDSISTTGGLFGKLINTGYSLLWNKSDCPDTSTPSPVCSDPTKLSSPAKAMPADGAKSMQTAKASSPGLLGGTGGVLGTMTSFRKSGIL